MSDPSDTVARKRQRGRPPHGVAPMSAAERQRRRRAAKQRQRKAEAAETKPAQSTAASAKRAKPSAPVETVDSRTAMARDAARARRAAEAAEEHRWRARMAAAEEAAGVRVRLGRLALQQAGLLPLPRGKRRAPAAETQSGDDAEE